MPAFSLIWHLLGQFLGLSRELSRNFPEQKYEKDSLSLILGLKSRDRETNQMPRRCRAGYVLCRLCLGVRREQEGWRLA